MTNLKIALVGNPNVGKSSLFNRLTGLDQHTGNWTGKTVELAFGVSVAYPLDFVDLPGAYSLRARSVEEKVTRDYIQRGAADVIIAVCDACNVERGLPLILQLFEQTSRVIVCVNQIDEAAAQNIIVDLQALEAELGVPIVATSAKSGAGIARLCEVIQEVAAHPPHPHRMRYPPELERELSRLAPLGFSRSDLVDAVIDNAPDEYASLLLTRPIIIAEAIACRSVSGHCGYRAKDQTLDAILTHRIWSIPLMLSLLAGILWLTVSGSNYPSSWLESFFSLIEETLYQKSVWLPDWISEPLIRGVLHTLFSVIAVMLPPMAIFFPLFTFAEEFGLLGRIAFNLDGVLHRCGACGKQALTMCMSLGCSAVGAIGCRIIDSPRERKIAILTASFMPCNGKFPLLIAVSTLLVGAGASALSVTALILLAIVTTFAVSSLLTHTLLRGERSAFALELPSYRRPQLKRILVHALVDKTLRVLGRAAAVAAPAGLFLWIFSQLSFHDVSLLALTAKQLDRLGKLLGLDGVIVLSILLSFPANELTLPLILTGYTSLGVTPEWSTLTCLNLLLITLFHFPCAATLQTIRQETDRKTAAAASAIPTAIGILLCLFTKAVLGPIFS